MSVSLSLSLLSCDITNLLLSKYLELDDVGYEKFSEPLGVSQFTKDTACLDSLDGTMSPFQHFQDISATSPCLKGAHQPSTPPVCLVQ